MDEQAICSFCGKPAITIRRTLCQTYEPLDSGVHEKPVCQEHADFFDWSYGILGELVRKRQAVHDAPEKKKR